LSSLVAAFGEALVLLGAAPVALHVLLKSPDGRLDLAGQGVDARGDGGLLARVSVRPALAAAAAARRVRRARLRRRRLRGGGGAGRVGVGDGDAGLGKLAGELFDGVAGGLFGAFGGGDAGRVGGLGRRQAGEGAGSFAARASWASRSPRSASRPPGARLLRLAVAARMSPSRSRHAR
jgi:hypothetical protein